MKPLWALVLLAACAKAPIGPTGNVPGLLRNPTAPLASQTDASADRLKGGWVIRQAAGVSGFIGQKVDISQNSVGELVVNSPTDPCAGDSSNCDDIGQTLSLADVGAGRWNVVQATGDIGDEQLWVHWLDFDDRTAAIGSPSGKFVWIMDRSATGGSDRIAAARDILTWYGYDTSKLVEVSQ